MVLSEWAAAMDSWGHCQWVCAAPHAAPSCLHQHCILLSGWRGHISASAWFAMRIYFVFVLSGNTSRTIQMDFWIWAGFCSSHTAFLHGWKWKQTCICQDTKFRQFGFSPKSRWYWMTELTMASRPKCSCLRMTEMLIPAVGFFSFFLLLIYYYYFFPSGST